LVMNPDEYEIRTINVSDLLLDPQNPRFLDLKLEKDHELAQQELQNQIEGEDDTITLVKAVRKDGVLDPIWVKKKGEKYLVLEGNRRTVALRMLMKEGAKPPAGISYERVRAHIVPITTSEQEEALLKIILQAGKLKWGRYNEAAYVYLLRHHYELELKDIADSMQTSVSDIKERIDNYRLFHEYVKETGHNDPHHFSYFSDAPKRVKDWFSESKENKGKYFKLISPVDGKQKIRSVATKGGLRDFAKVLDDKEALEFLLKEPEANVEDAVQLALEHDILKEIPFIKQVGSLAGKLRALNEQQVSKLKSETQFKVELKSLQTACGDLLDKLKRA
jgi:hypothetical protein